MSDFTLVTGDCREVMRTMAAGSVHCCVTSPPYFGLRDYGVDGQLGLEKTPDEYVANMVEVFREVWRVLRDDGTLWLNIGDSYAGSWGNQGRKEDPGLKAKDLIGIPWMLAFALRSDGWYLRSDIIWAKPNPMPESVTDRPTKAHEYIFLFSKQSHYFYDAEAIAEATERMREYPTWEERKAGGAAIRRGDPSLSGDVCRWAGLGSISNGKRNRRSVWTVTTQPFAEAHFATFPPALIEPCILAGTSEHGCCAKCGAPWQRVVERGASMWEQRKQDGAPMRHGDVDGGRTNAEKAFSGATLAAWKSEHPDKTVGWQPTCPCDGGRIPCTVLDPFTGSGTTGVVTIKHARNFVGIELKPEYVEMARKRIGNAPLSLFAKPDGAA